MSRVVGYSIESGHSADELCNKVLDTMSRPGWRPVGGVVVAKDVFYQAMVLNEDQETYNAEIRKYQDFLDEHPDLSRPHDTPTNDGQ